ncbi:MAG: GNAT family N-acetyltransferase [Syntrophorhabdaceae bacterium]|nr:GNAT family N-acetyltransferase [Syntrophorhabdaceae bacterium]
MVITLSPITADDRLAVMEIFNYYIENTFAAYPEVPLPDDFLDMLLIMSNGYPTVAARTEEGVVAGFGLLRPYNPLPAFFKTAEITYFLKPEFMGQGIGKAILDYLLDMGKEKGIHSILANVSSLNEQSIQFHAKNGFSECGRLREVGQKKGRVFDVVYFQKLI